jgi:glycosyltransferase involved in cell wall biosynthesis
MFKERTGKPPTDLVFTGSDSGNLDHIIGEARALGIYNHIKFKSFINQEELIILYRNAKAILFPTLLGPTNIPPLEAMSLGKYVSISPESSFELDDLSGFEINDSQNASVWVKFFDPDWIPPEVNALKNRKELIKRNHENEVTIRKLLEFIAHRIKI